MIPTLQVGDRISVRNKKDKKFSRGEIVTFASPYKFDPLLKKSIQPSKWCDLHEIPYVGILFQNLIKSRSCDTYIKRLVALPGEKVFVNKRGEVQINGKLLSEPYVKNYCEGQICSRINESLVPSDHFLVLGDNRSNSWDSRYWPGGPFIHKKYVRGVAYQIWFPFERSRQLNP